jgi:vesicle-associated membrane protein 7
VGFFFFFFFFELKFFSIRFSKSKKNKTKQNNNNNWSRFNFFFEMPILYGLVARGPTVLAEYFATTGNAPKVARRILARLPAGDHRKSYQFENAFYHYHADANGLVVLVMSDDPDNVSSESALGTRVSFACIQDLRNQFLGMCGSLWHTAAEAGLNESFARIIRDKLDYYSNDPEADKIRKARGQIEQVKEVMKVNIEKVLDRGDQIEDLMGRANDLEENAGDFKRSATTFKRKMWWKNKKICICMSAISVIVIIIIIIVIVNLFT